MFADSYSHITIKIYNNSYGTFEVDQPNFYNGHLDSSQPEKGDALMAFSATSPNGKGGNSRVSGFFNITLNGSVAFSCYFCYATNIMLHPRGVCDIYFAPVLRHLY
ncbi:hypothetical protein [Caedibacter taeniospiralis]|uniref:hypothetical protein n=1 Tax=Caedibacter taeniospiralis TaxID=28907 RepID=UPI0037C14B85